MAAVDNLDLLSALRSLFMQVTRMNLAQRLNHSKKSSAKVSVDISEKLQQCIDKLSASSQKDRAIIASQADAAADGVEVTPISSSRELEPVADTDLYNGLSDHFQQCRHSSVSESSMGYQLQQRTWHHLYAALSSARKGNEAMAKLHANIASQAMKEADSYMDDESYAHFTDQIKLAIAS